MHSCVGMHACALSMQWHQSDDNPKASSQQEKLPRLRPVVPLVYAHMKVWDHHLFACLFHMAVFVLFVLHVVAEASIAHASIMHHGATWCATHSVGLGMMRQSV